MELALDTLWCPAQDAPTMNEPASRLLQRMRTVPHRLIRVLEHLASSWKCCSDGWWILQEVGSGGSRSLGGGT